jgi:alkylation response protein AidB-like acyl-CoA dehydrogenase
MNDLNFELDESAQALLDRISELRKTRFSERALGHDKAATFPIENFHDLHDDKLLELSVARAYGGHGADLWGNFLLEIMAVEELSRGCSATGQGFHNHNSTLETINVLGNDEQRERFAREVVGNGAVLAVWASERGGKTVLDTKTKARQVDGGYIVNGEKFFSTNSGGATWFQVWACLEGKSLEEGMVPCMIHRDAPGVTIVGDWDPMGQRATTSGSTRYKDVFVPEEDAIGAPGDYYKLLLFGPYFQLGWAAVHVGIAGGALEAGLDYVTTKTRPWCETELDRAIDDPYIQNHVADMSIQLEASQLLLYRAARALERAAQDISLRPYAAVAVYRAKAISTTAAIDISTRIFEICGARAAAGAPKSGMDMYWRNARTFTLHDPVDYRKQRIGRYLLGVEDPPIGWF